MNKDELNDKNEKLMKNSERCKKIEIRKRMKKMNEIWKRQGDQIKKKTRKKNKKMGVKRELGRNGEGRG